MFRPKIYIFKLSWFMTPKYWLGNHAFLICKGPYVKKRNPNHNIVRLDWRFWICVDSAPWCSTTVCILMYCLATDGFSFLSSISGGSDEGCHTIKAGGLVSGLSRLGSGWWVSFWVIVWQPIMVGRRDWIRKRHLCKRKLCQGKCKTTLKNVIYNSYNPVAV